MQSGSWIACRKRVSATTTYEAETANSLKTEHIQAMSASVVLASENLDEAEAVGAVPS